MTRNLLLYAHFNKRGEVASYVLYQLEKLRQTYDYILFISNSPIKTVDKVKLDGIVDEVIQRENVGFDFAAWSVGLFHLGRTKVAEYENVTVMNDTCFGPIFALDLTPPLGTNSCAVSSLETDENTSETSVWAMTDCRALKKNEYKRGHPGRDLPWHLQSYFVTFRAAALNSDRFWEFWGERLGGKESDVQAVIDQYEVGMSKVFADFHPRASFATSALPSKHLPNFAIFEPTKCLENGVPFIKIKAFLYDSEPDCYTTALPKHLVEHIERNTNYPATLIREYFDVFDWQEQKRKNFEARENAKLTTRIVRKLRALCVR
ncbi:MAG: rhamnan synthesis F family protein [Candidatus Ancillula sp.]|jgi:rhamnosyltransferase|nr:rhamnan synthesis F family protein [Candidatus Ancillula sp.]